MSASRGLLRAVLDPLASGGTRALEAGLKALPAQGVRGAGRSLAGLLYHVLRLRRRVVETQLVASFPDRDSAWVGATARACYRHFGEELATMAAGRLEPALGLVDRDTRAESKVRAALGDRGGALIVTGHLGNWELAGAFTASLGMPTTAVARRQSGGVDRRIGALRDRYGLEVVFSDESPRKLLRPLREGGVLAIVADQHTRRGGAPLEFMGRPAWTSLGPARLCLATEAPLFFAAVVRDGPRYRVVFEEVDREESGGPRPEVELTRRWLAALERAIRARPEQYFWFHRRWKGQRAAAAARNAARASDVTVQLTREGPELMGES